MLLNKNLLGVGVLFLAKIVANLIENWPEVRNMGWKIVIKRLLFRMRKQ